MQMDAIKQWAFSVCVAAVACSLAQIVMPKSGMQRVFQITVSVFFLCCLISPLIVTPLSLDFPEISYEQGETQYKAESLEKVVEEQIVQNAEQQMRQEIVRNLEEMQIKFNKITISINTTGQNSISISECEVELPQEYHTQKVSIQKELETRLQIEVKVRVIGEDKADEQRKSDGVDRETEGNVQ